jgi:CheY-like chemotaxis protein
VVTLTGVEEDEGQKAQITIRDTGKGIKPEFLPFLFDRFSQSDVSSIRTHGGMGLGLSIVQSLVELQGGKVEASSPGEGHGSTFTVSFPLLEGSLFESFEDPQAPSLAASPEPAVPKYLSGIKVLWVEDDAASRTAVELMLDSQGAMVTSASSAGEAIAVFKQFRPDVIVSDISMPQEDGYSLIRKIRSFSSQKGGNTPALALTAYADSTSRDTAFAAGFQEHLAKPVDANKLVRAILNVKKITSSSTQ